MTIYELDPGNFDSAVKIGNSVVTFCKPGNTDHATDNAVIEAATEDRGALFYKVNAAKHPSLAKRFGIDSFPSTLFFSDGALTGRRSGAICKDEMISGIGRAARMS